MASSSVPASPAEAVDRSSGGTLRIVPDHASPAGEADVTLVLDTTWTPPAADPAGHGPRILSVRDVVERVLADRDLIEETSERLDAWASRSGVVEALTIDTTSFWYYVRLRHWVRLQEWILWAFILDDVVRELRPARVILPAGTEASIADVLPLLARRDGFVLEGETGAPASAAAPVAGAGAVPAPSRSPEAPPGRRLARSLRRRVDRLLGRTPVDPVAARMAAVRERVDLLEAEPGRLLVARHHDSQLVDTADGPRVMNPYLDPIVDRLRGTVLEPVTLDMRARVRNDDDWARLQQPGNERDLPFDVLRLDDVELPADDLAWTPELVPVPLVGIDLGPLLAADVVAGAREWLPMMRRSVERIERLLRRLRPAGVLLADEYHRQDWLAAGRRVGVPIAAVQHGLIYPRHNGYMHPDRPPQLQLAARTYVFGRWERDLLVQRSVYRPDEVGVGGSGRLDLVRDDPAGAAALRHELGIRDDERLLLVSGTWGRIYRRFHYPIALARIVDRPLPGVHLVVKLHPGERDDGPYRAIIESAAAAGGFEPPPITIVRSVDLYRILAASDAHLGIHSTVLTEAVVTRTPNLLADQLHGADLLGYVAAGVAVPVRDGGDVLAALAPTAVRASEEASAAFVRAHFEPGNASARIADDLLGWLA